MAPAQVLSIPTASFGFRARTSDGPTRTIAAAITQKPRNHNHNQDLVVGSKLAAADHPHRRPTKSRVDVDQLVKFLYDDLHHVFDEQGIDPTAYDEEIEFRDPITKYGDIRGYLLNIALLRQFFSPQIILHWVKKTGPYEITTRWTAAMKFALLPWKPECVLTGTSIMTINPNTGKFCRHVDLWDSVQNNDYFSIEGLWDVFKQFRFYETPELELPKYQTLKRTENYEVRKYGPFAAAERSGENLFECVNSISGWGDCKEDDRIMELRNKGGIAAVLNFSGKATEEKVKNKAKELRHYLKKDGLKSVNNNSCLLVRYNDSNHTWSFVMRNEVLIWLQDFSI